MTSFFVESMKVDLKILIFQYWNSKMLLQILAARAVKFVESRIFGKFKTNSTEYVL